MRGSDENWPKTVEEAVEQLLVIVDKDYQAQIKQTPLEDVVGMLHFGGFGTQVRNRFGLWGDNKELRQDCGYEDIHPEDASGIIIRAFWERLNERPDWNKNYRRKQPWTEIYKMPQTVEEAVELLIIILPEKSKENIKRTVLSNSPFDPTYILLIEEMFRLNKDNEALVEACGSKEMPGKSAAEVIIRALWKKLNQREDWYQNNKHWTYSYSRADTLEKAVDHLVLTMSEELKAEIKQTPETRIIGLNLSYGRFIRNIFGLEDNNKTLIKSCGMEGLHPANASKVILIALWKKLNELQ